MSSLITIVVLLFGVAVALAAPLADTLGQTPDVVVEKRATGTMTGQAAATLAGAEYIVDILIEGVTKRVLLDSGSADLWIKGDGTSAPPGKPFGTNNGGSSVSGTWTTGNVTIGGISLTNQPYGTASNWSGHTGYDGVLGVSANYNQFRGAAPTWLAVLTPQLPRPVMSLNLPKAGGTISLGYEEPTHEAAPPTYFPLTTPWDSWHLNITGFGVPTNDTSANCLLDTGTTDLFVPLSVAEAYWSQVQGATSYGTGKWEFPCSSTLPDFVPRIDSHLLTVPGWANVLKSGGKCYSRLRGASPDSCTFGQPFFFGQYAVFDFANQQVGLTGMQ